MPLRIPLAPNQSIETVISALKDLSMTEELSSAVSADTWKALTKPGGPRLFYPHQVFSIGLDDLSHGSGVDHASLVSWRFLLEGNIGEAVAAVEVNVKNDTYSFSLINEGHFVTQTFLRVQTIEYDLRMQQVTYELQTLRIPALYVFALWLKPELEPEEENGDILMPMSPTHHLVEPLRSYSMQDLESVLRDATSETLQFDNRPP